MLVAAIDEEPAMDDPFNRPTFTPSVSYRDPAAALDWLERAFGFARTMVITDDGGAVVHAEMSFHGRGQIMVGGEWSDLVSSPASVGGKNTQRIHVHMNDGLDAHCERARAAGAEVIREPQEEFYGDRTYLVRDLEGHAWTFSQSVRTVTREEAEKASGLKIDGWVGD
jgi:uncharacterized glyoxalase superfamily protein PhnB